MVVRKWRHSRHRATIVKTNGTEKIERLRHRNSVARKYTRLPIRIGHLHGWMNRWIHAAHRTAKTVIQIESGWRKRRYMNVIRAAQQTTLDVITFIIIAVICCRIVIIVVGVVVIVIVVGTAAGIC